MYVMFTCDTLKKYALLMYYNSQLLFASLSVVRILCVILTILFTLLINHGSHLESSKLCPSSLIRDKHGWNIVWGAQEVHAESSYTLYNNSRHLKSSATFFM